MPSNREIELLHRLNKRKNKKISSAKRSESPVELLPLNQRPPVSVGEWFVQKVPYKPSKRDLRRMRSGELDPLDFAERKRRAEKTAATIFDAIVPQSGADMAMYAGAGALGAGAKTLVKLGKRAGVNIPAPESYAIRGKLEQIIDAYKDRPADFYKAIRYDVPINKRLIQEAKSMGSSDNYNFLLTQDYFLRRGLKLPSTPIGLKNKKFLENNPGYIPVAKGWQKMMDNIVEYTIVDSKTGKVMPYASFGELPDGLKRALKNKQYGLSVEEFPPFGGFTAFKGSRVIKDSPIKGAREIYATYRDVSDFNPNMGKTIPYISEKLKAGGKLGDILKHKSNINTRYGADIGSDLFRGILSKFMKPITWQGEMAWVQMPKSAKLASNINKSGKAWKIKRVFDPKTAGVMDIEEARRLSIVENRYMIKKGKDGKYRLMELVEASPKQLDWGKKVAKANKYLRDKHYYEGVKRFNR
jgi:hypothetical protein